MKTRRINAKTILKKSKEDIIIHFKHGTSFFYDTTVSKRLTSGELLSNDQRAVGFFSGWLQFGEASFCLFDGASERRGCIGGAGG